MSWLLALLATALSVGHVTCQIDQSAINYLARFLDFRFQVIDNLHDQGTTCQLLFNLTNRGNIVIQTGPWSIFFNKIRGIAPSQLGEGLAEQGWRLDRVHDTLYRLSPTRNFFPLPRGESRIIRFLGLQWMSSRSDVMPNVYVTADGLIPRVIANTRDEGLEYGGTYNSLEQWKRDTDDLYNPPTTQERFQRNQGSEGEAGGTGGTGGDEWRRRLIPQPLIAVFDTSRDLTIADQWAIVADSQVNWEANFLAGQLRMNRPTQINQTNDAIRLRMGQVDLSDVTDRRLFNSSDAYRLTADPTTNTVEITGQGPSGVFYGIHSLLMLLNGGRVVPQMRITDAPRFEYRGMHLDVSRNFLPKQDVLRLLGAMSVYKINKFHFHLSDDQGWRLEIPGLPDLTRFGSRRCHDLSENLCLLPQIGSGPDTGTSGSGFYTIADYREILQFARQRHIEVIPEFDMPGHSRAAIKSMEVRQRRLARQRRAAEGRAYLLTDERSSLRNPREEMFHNNAINPCVPSTYRFVDHVLNELVQMHRDVNPLRVFHFGGDEVWGRTWNHSISCQRLRLSDPVANVSLARYFANRVSRLAAARNLSLGGWEDGLVHDGKLHDRRELATPDVFVYPWNNHWQWGHYNNSYRLANAGFKVIMSQATHLYFDHPYEADPEERGLIWATRFTDTRKVFDFSPLNLYSNIDWGRSGEPLSTADVCGDDGSHCVQLTSPENVIGMQGHLWTETVRTADQMDYMIYPRLLALAERAWHEAPWEHLPSGPQRLLQETKDWNSFISAVGHREIRRMDQAGIQYRIPPPGARMEGTRLVTNNVYPGMPVQFRSRDTDRWQDVPRDMEIRDNQTLFLRSRSHDSRRFSRGVPFTPHPAPTLPIVTLNTIEMIAEYLQVNLTVIDNTAQPDRSLVDMTLTNTNDSDIVAGNWEIYMFSFGQLFPPNLVHNPQGYILQDHKLRFTHVKGSLFKFQPVPGFRALRPNEPRVVRLVVGMSLAARNHVLPNWYVTAEGMSPRTLNATKGEELYFLGPFTNGRQWKTGIDDRYNPWSLEDRFTVNQLTEDLGGPGGLILPTPLETQIDNSSSVLLSECCWGVAADTTFIREAQFLVATLNMSSVTLSWNRLASRVIELRRGNPDVRVNGQVTSSREAYTLTVDPGRQVVTIVSRDPAGAFYGVQSLLSLCRDGTGGFTGEVPRATVKDAPRLEYRGLLMEVARNFRSKEEVMKVMNVMAAYKMNRFLFHLGDDEGWRLEIPGLPDLTRVAGRRCHDLTETNCLLPQLGSGGDNSTSGSGFYTVEDYREIIRYAAERHIEVVEMFDMPGHSRAGIIAMQARQARLRDLGDPTADDFLLTDADDNLDFLSVQMFDDNMVNPCLDSTYRFIRHVLQEVQRMRRDIDPMRTYHFVGGEVRDVFVNSSACRARRLDRNGVREFFAERVSRIASDLRITLSGWVDGLMETGETPLRRLSNIHTAMVWNNAWTGGRANRAYRMANAGYKVVLGHATHLYLDHPQEPDPLERGLFWATRYTDARKMFWYTPDDVYSNVDVTFTGEPLTRQGYCARRQDMCLPLERPRNIIGIQAQIFSEMTRTAEQQEGLIYPRLLAVAERAWHRAAWENLTDVTARNASRVQDWSRFANTLGYKELPFLDRLGVSYRVPPPGARGQGRRWEVNTEYPNQNVEVSYDNGATWDNVVSDTVTAPDEEVPHFRTRSPVQQRYSRVVPSSSVNVAPFSSVVAAITVITLIVQLCKR
ncbi:uncharacterized protein LOC124127161 [Haliotis rufescens]|uniref:uncharacterized protein LOC124127161 n=1 Tax=Haliotis rufescens TaxID=6454 RepID=UPI00201F5C62|nr:uncharacterized protein LOC124127161 [Haliotis rufescens]